MTDKEKTFLRAALEYLAKNEIELNYTFFAPFSVRPENGEPFCSELDAFIEKRPHMEDLFLRSVLDNGQYDHDCGAFLYDFVVDDVNNLYDEISADDNLFEEFLRSLCFDEDGKIRDFLTTKDVDSDSSKTKTATLDDAVISLNDKGFHYIAK